MNDQPSPDWGRLTPAQRLRAFFIPQEWEAALKELDRKDINGDKHEADTRIPR